MVEVIRRDDRPLTPSGRTSADVAREAFAILAEMDVLIGRLADARVRMVAVGDCHLRAHAADTFRHRESNLLMQESKRPPYRRGLRETAE